MNNYNLYIFPFIKILLNFPQDPSLFALFLLPVLLIAGSLAVGLLLLRGSPKWQELHWAHTEAGSMLAYEQLHAEQMADTV